MKITSVCLLVFLVVCSFSNQLFGNEPGKILDVNKFNAVNQKKLSRSIALVEKGNSIWQEANGLNDEIEMLKTESHFAKAKKRENKKQRLLLQASGYFRDGHKGQYKIVEDELKAIITKSESNEAREALMNGDGLFKKARKYRLKAESRSSNEKIVELLYDAAAIENEALTLMEVLMNPENITTEDAMPMAIIVKDSIPDIVEDSIPEIVADSVLLVQESFQEEKFIPAIQAPVPDVVEPAAVATPIVTVDPTAAIAGVIQAIEPEPVISEAKKVFFSIQILADRKEVSDAAISKVYAGSLKVTHVIGDGWHRYMVGQFKSLPEARQSMTQESIKGFIVAYNGETRITVKEAVELLKD